MLHLSSAIVWERFLQTAVEMPSVQSHSSVSWGLREVGHGRVSFAALDWGVGFYVSLCPSTDLLFFFF